MPEEIAIRPTTEPNGTGWELGGTEPSRERSIGATPNSNSGRPLRITQSTGGEGNSASPPPSSFQKMEGPQLNSFGGVLVLEDSQGAGFVWQGWLCGHGGLEQVMGTSESEGFSPTRATLPTLRTGLGQSSLRANVSGRTACRLRFRAYGRPPAVYRLYLPMSCPSAKMCPRIASSSSALVAPGVKSRLADRAYTLKK